MCGRYSDVLTWDEIVRLYRIAVPATPPNLQPRYNIAPTQEAAVVRRTAEGQRELAFLRWGLIPAWSRDGASRPPLINARADSLGDRPAFREAFRRRRCLVPADGFYEWRQGSKDKQPYRITLKEGGGFAFAGLWERREAAGGEPPVESFTIVTTAANDLLRPLHERMPVILEEGDYEAWLDVDGTPPERAQRALRPFPDARLAVYPVNRHVNNVRHDDPECIAPERLLL